MENDSVSKMNEVKAISEVYEVKAISEECEVKTISEKKEVKAISETKVDCLPKVECPPNYEYISHGGYADIFYNSNINLIIKNQPLYYPSESKSICESSIFESIVLSSLVHVKHIPKITNIEIDKNKSNINIYMPNYGTSLDKITDKTQLQQNAGILLLSLVESCYSLYLNGIQHTDIKPSNILVNDDFTTIKLIDLNILSIKSSGNNNYGWSYGIGTWCYCEPSIIYNDEPSDTGMVWSFGLILAYIFGDHPLLEYFPKLYKYNKKDWKLLMNNIKTRHRICLPLTKKHTSVMTSDLYNLFNICTQWDWDKRPTLAKLYHAMINLYGNDNIKLDTKLITYNNISITPHKNGEDRSKYYNSIWQVCKLTGRYDLLCRILILVDLYPDKLTDDSIVGCIYIAYIISGHSLKDKYFDRIITKFYYDITETCIIPDLVLSNIILLTVEKLKWQCYFQTPDTVIINYGIEQIKQNVNEKINDKYEYLLMDKLYGSYKFYKTLYNIIHAQENPYTVYEICEHLFKEIKQIIEVE